MANPTLNTYFRIKSHGGGGNYLTVSGSTPLTNHRSLYLTTAISSNMQYWKVIASGNSYKIVSCADQSFALNYYWNQGYGNPGACDIYLHADNNDSYVAFDMSGHAAVYRIKQTDSRLSSNPLYLTPSSWSTGASVTWEHNEGGDVVQYWQFEPVSASVYALVTEGYSGLNNSEQETNATYIYNALIDAGFTKNAACGVLGNIERECGFNPGAWQVSNNTSYGFGLVQWTPATKFINYAYDNDIITSKTATAVNNLTNTNAQTLMDTEIDCIQWCCTNGDFFAPSSSMQHTNHSMTYSQYKKSTLDAGTLAVVFHDHFERSADTAANLQKYRATYATKWYNFFD